MLFINKADSDSVFANNQECDLIVVGTYISTEHKFACDVVYDATPATKETELNKGNAAPEHCWFLQWGNGAVGVDFMWITGTGTTFLGERKVRLRAHVPVTVDMIIEWAMQQPAFKNLPDELRAYAYVG